jgi:predicted branched-subunit amino acid permease
MFIALLVLQIKERVQIVIALLAGMVSVGLLLAGLDQWNVIVATVIVATLGVALEQWNKK